MHLNVVEDSIRKARQAQGWYERLVVSRHCPSCSPMMEAEARSSRMKARYVFRWKSQANRAQDEWLCVLPGSSSRKELVESSSRAQTFLPSFLPAFLSFRRYALCGAPVAPACIDRHQMASGNLTRPRAAPLRPRNPRHRHPVRITLAIARDFASYREGLPIFMTQVKGFFSC